MSALISVPCFTFINILYRPFPHEVSSLLIHPITEYLKLECFPQSSMTALIRYPFMLLPEINSFPITSVVPNKSRAISSVMATSFSLDDDDKKLLLPSKIFTSIIRIKVESGAIYGYSVNCLFCIVKKDCCSNAHQSSISE